MNPTQMAQIVETIKSLDVTFDGNLNSETVTEVVRIIMPYFYLVQIKSFVVSLVWAIAFTISAYLIGKALFKVFKENE